MRLRRLSNETEFFTHLADLATSLRTGTLILAELTGIPMEERRDAVSRLTEVTDAADAAESAVLRALRENYATPVDRDSLYRLASTLREAVHRLEAVGFALSSSAFDEFPVGVHEFLAVLSNASDQTHTMLQRLPAKPDQWQYVESMSRLFHRAEMLHLQVSDAVPAARRGLVHLAAATLLGQMFYEAARSFAGMGAAVAEIAVRES